MLAPPLDYAGNHAAVIRCVHLDHVAVFAPAAIHKESVRHNGSDRHLGHDFLIPGGNDLKIIRRLQQRMRDSARRFSPLRKLALPEGYFSSFLYN